MNRIFKFINIISLNLWFYFWAPFVLLANFLISTPIVICSRIFGHRNAMRVFRRSISIYGKSVYLTAWPWIKIKLLNSPPQDSNPYIFVENHTSAFDPFVQAVLPFEIVQFARNYALRFPILGKIAKWSGYIDVNGHSPENIIKIGKRLLSEKVSLIIFPEGTRHTNGVVGPFHTTAFKLALETGATLVPVVIKGIENKPPKGSFFFRPGIVEIKCLDPITLDEFQDMTPYKLKKYVRNIIKEKYEN